jgi:outer membrane protease
MRLSWITEGGYFQYAAEGGAWSSDIPKTSVYGPGIQYTQNWLILTPAVSVTGRINHRLSAAGSFRYTPLVFCRDKDHHFVPSMFYNGRTFSGEFSFGHFFDGRASLIFSAAQNLELSLNAGYRHITGMRGENEVLFTYYFGSAGTRFQNAYDAGAGYSALDIGLRARFILGEIFPNRN